MRPRASLLLQPVLESAARARAEVRSVLGPIRSASLVEAATVIVSELVTNVVCHARTDLRLDLEFGTDQVGPYVRIVVSDRSTALPTAHDAASDAARGRGLVLVDRLADAWGVEPRPGGKSVWAELRDPPAPRDDR